MIGKCILRISLCVFIFLLSGVAQANTPDRILVVYNANWIGDNDNDGIQDSLQVANYYAVRRGIPAGNMLGVACSTGSSYYYGSANYEKFYNEMVIPIRDRLSSLGPTNIDILLFCYGVPITVPKSDGGNVCIDNALMIINYLTETNNIARRSNPYRENSPGFSTDKTHFDHATYNYSGMNMYLTCRIDSQNAPWGPMSLIDQALYGERYIYESDGYYKGNAYIDGRYGDVPGGPNERSDESLAADTDVINGSYSSYGAADKNMAYGEHAFLSTGFPLKWEDTGIEIGEIGATFMDSTSAEYAPEALFYGGWYNFGNYHDVWEWLPGAIACDLNSNSLTASGLRSGGTSSFSAAALQRGATCASGVIGEPYLTGHQRPNVLLHYIMQGYNFVEASALSTPSVGWMPINVGDPLYTPLKAKTAVLDTQPPALAATPSVSDNVDSGTRTITVVLDQSMEPEVASVIIDYGYTTAYGLSAESGQGYWAARTIDLAGLQGNSTYHYRVTLTDPVGNITVSDDYAFTTGSVPNTMPTADDQTFICEHDKTSNLTLTASDPEGNALTYSVVAGPGHGVLTGSGASLAYTPTSGYSGSDSFTFKANDGALESDIATVTIHIMETEEVTIVFQEGLDSYAGTFDAYVEDSNMDRNYGGSNAIRTYHDGKRRILLGFDITSVPSNAAVSSASLALFCTGYSYPSANKPINLYHITRSWIAGTQNGGDSPDGVTWREFDYTDADATTGGDWTALGGDYDEATVHAQQSTANLRPNTWVDWQIRDLTQSWVAGTQANNGMLIRTHNSSLSISYFSSEATDSDKRPKLTIKYFPAPGSNQPPLAHNQATTTTEDTARAITLTATDSDGDGLTYTIVSEPSNGALSGTAPSVTYTPSTGFTGNDSFTFRANDGTDSSNIATVSITVNPSGTNAPPEFIPLGPQKTLEGQEISITLAATDADGDPITFTTSGPGEITGATYTYTPGFGDAGTENITFTADDENGGTDTLTIALVIGPDTDGDGIEDATDNDIDGDGIINANDKDADGNDRSQDFDNDGINDRADTDIDGDGIANADDTDADGNDLSRDHDNDGSVNGIDTDDDNDGISDADEAKRGTNPINPDPVDPDQHSGGSGGCFILSL